MGGMRFALEGFFIALQAVIVAFLFLHDLIPLGRLNNNAAKRREDPMPNLLLGTLLAALPAAIGLYGCARYFGLPYPGWLNILLAITYGIFLLGMMRTWWIPYLLVPDAERAARYQIIFKDTHAFLPRRNGIVPDTLHTVFHLAVLGTVVIFAVRSFS